MPKSGRKGRARAGTLPKPVARSGKKAQRTFAKAHDAALAQYGDEERAHRVAYAALKHSFEKVGKRWEPKAKRGPSDPQAEGGTDTDRPTAGGVDANASKAHLYDVAKRLDVPGRSTMSKAELVEAIQKANRKADAAARG
jgi:cation transport regulator ChaB